MRVTHALSTATSSRDAAFPSRADASGVCRLHATLAHILRKPQVLETLVTVMCLPPSSPKVRLHEPPGQDAAQPTIEATRVISRLYLGSAHTHTSLAYMKSIGVTHVVIAHAAPQTAVVHFPHEFTYLMAEVPSDPLPSELLSWLPVLNTVIDEARQQGTVLCVYPMARDIAAAASAAYVMTRRGISLPRALDLVCPRHLPDRGRLLRGGAPLAALEDFARLLATELSGGTPDFWSPPVIPSPEHSEAGATADDASSSILASQTTAPRMPPRVNIPVVTQPPPPKPPPPPVEPVEPVAHPILTLEHREVAVARSAAIPPIPARAERAAALVDADSHSGRLRLRALNMTADSMASGALANQPLRGNAAAGQDALEGVLTFGLD
jgi:hypothetical protein